MSLLSLLGKMICLFVLILLIAVAPIAGLSDITVNEDCSLHDAIKAANIDESVGGCRAGKGADRIILTEDVALVVELPAIGSDIFIAGQGHTVSGYHTYRIFDIEAGDVTINNLTLIEGGGYQGGAIRVRPGASLIVNKSAFINNSAADSGGAIMSGGRLFVKDSAFKGNSARQRGGAILVWGEDATLLLTNTLISGNSASLWGGGIAINRAAGTIASSIIRANRAYEGGAIRSAGSKLNVMNSTIGANRALHSGGALSKSAGQVKISASALLNNRAEVNGGAISSELGSMSIVNSSLGENIAVRHGGALHVSDTVFLTHVTLANNEAAVGGGVYRARGAINLVNSIIAGSQGGDCVGGLYINSANLIQDGSCDPALSGDPMFKALWGSPATYLLAKNSPAIDAGDRVDCEPKDQSGKARPQGRNCDIGAFEYVHGAQLPAPTKAPEQNAPPVQDPQAGIIVNESCSLAFAIIAANTDWAIGGCPAGKGADTITLAEDIILTAALPSITSEITIEGEGNTISGGGRFRILGVNGGKLTLNHARLTQGRSASGAAIRSYSGTIIINHSTIEDNMAWSDILSFGGGILCWPCNLSINHSIIRRNTAAGDGGGIYFANTEAGESLQIRHSLVEGNQARNGAGLYFGAGADSPTSTITGSSFSYNWALDDGGGISIAGEDFSRELVLEDSTLHHNEAANGAGLYVDNQSVATLRHVTFAHNSANYGSSIYIAPKGALNLYNSMAAGQDRNEECYGQLNGNSGNLIADGSCDPALTNRVWLDQLVLPDDGGPAYFPPRPGSPAIDAAIDEHCTGADQIGRPRRKAPPATSARSSTSPQQALSNKRLCQLARRDLDYAHQRVNEPRKAMTPSRRAILILIALLAIAPAASPVHAGDITVDGACSLVAAINAANTDRAFGGCPAGDGADVISLGGDVELEVCPLIYLPKLPLRATAIRLSARGFCAYLQYLRPSLFYAMSH